MRDSGPAGPGFTDPVARAWCVDAWEQAGRPLTFARYETLCRLLRTLQGYGRVPTWYDEPGPLAGGQTPRELREAGLLDDLEQRLRALAGGDFG